ncbi:MAG: UvrD-helicase domain-containing protein [Betaproteobacteria bacterium]|nr:UvrD-helicase domain-containing protein [Betaproteobacteria bacterium]MDH3435850.1 UvrD-helicase domain-containing protein [Betaproteobacteria bacterium]
MSPGFLSGLNEPQLEAVTLPHQSALVLAGAGSGKTRVLTTRAAWLIQTGQVSPMGLMAVTFTNKAAKEMLTRISAMLPINTRGMWVGTFHGLCNRMLRAHYREAGLPQLFQILDTQDQLSLVKRLLKNLNADEERFPPRRVQWFIAASKEEGLRAPEVEVHDEFTRRMKDIYAAYEEQCQREGVVDFAELLLRSYELLSRNEALRSHYEARFEHILVDEFQDTNRLQYRWLKRLAGARNAIFAVGDDDQSIYAFRGASAANMQDLQRDFAIERVIKLEQNYRSHGHILDAANALISQNRKRLGKNLWTSEAKGEPLRVLDALTDLEEAAFIVEEVHALRADGVALDDIAVLYRSNAQSRVIEHSLFKAGLPYRVYGGLRFFERQEIKHALAYLRLVANPDDDGALMRVINFPTRGIGSRSLEQLQDTAKERGTSLWGGALLKAEGGRQKAEEGSNTETSSVVSRQSSVGKGIPAFVTLIERMREATSGLPLPEAIEHVVEASGLQAHYRAEKEGADRLENLSELINAATIFVAERDVQPAGEAAGADEPDELTAFLAHAALEAGEHQAQAGAQALQLMTVHSAKGLEFHSVFISGLEEGLFPHENSLTEADGIEEERRLMYVALTRGRRRLYLSLAQSRMLHGQTRYNIASRFFQEIPEALMRRSSPRFNVQGSTFKVQRSRFSGPGLQSRAEGPEISALNLEPGTLNGQRATQWRVGQNVVHPAFGTGVIVNAEGRGVDARVQVNFRSGGLKWLMLEYARLAPA